ncbi:MAG: MerR family transcriptional regulator [Caulobacteraceae bacterium]|nr:MerR family transcriptional regulator [Caulobacteraceae bacterium]
MSKGPEAFRTISEAAEELGVPQHVLRFWETRFSFIRPMKRAGGRRFYRPQDLAVLKGVRTLLHDEGYTIKGVQKLHKEQGVRRLMAASGAVDEIADSIEQLEEALEFSGLERDRLEDALTVLESAKARLDAVLVRS